MYECQDCGRFFESALHYTERHGLDTPPFEVRTACPSCKSELIREIKIHHCRCCGAKLAHGNTEYCDDTCRRRDKRLRDIEASRRNSRYNHPLYITVREAEAYNRAHSTRYSYGEYVALILPRIKKGGDSQ